MKKKIVVLLGILALSIFSISSYAAEWKQEADGRWWYQYDDGTYPQNGWAKINGKDYYFDAEGYMLANTVTPDGYTVGADGAWIPDGAPAAAATQQSNHSVSNIQYGTGSVTDALVISDWSYVPEYFNSTYHIFEITNNSGKTLEININENAKNYSGEVIGASSVSQEDVPSGCTVFITNYFSDVTGVQSYDTTITAKEEDFYIPVIQDINVSVKDRGDKAIVTVANNGSLAAEFVEGTAVFFEGDEVVYTSSHYFDNDSFYLMPGASISEQMNAYSTFYTDVKVHVTGRRSKYSSK